MRKALQLSESDEDTTIKESYGPRFLKNREAFAVLTFSDF